MKKQIKHMSVVPKKCAHSPFISVCISLFERNRENNLCISQSTEAYSFIQQDNILYLHAREPRIFRVISMWFILE